MTTLGRQMDKNNTFGIHPHALQQNQVIEPILTRFKTWKLVVLEFMEMFQAVTDMEKGMIAIHRNFESRLEQREKVLGIAASSVFKAWKDYSSQLTTSLDTAHQKTEYSKRIENLKKLVQKKLSDFSKQLEGTQNAIDKHRSAAHKEMIAYEKVQFSRTRDVVASSIPHLQSDPWLNEKLIRQRLDHLVVAENEYQAKMKSLFGEFASFESQIIEELKKILEELNAFRKLYFKDLLKMMEQTAPSRDQVSPERLFAEFSMAHGLDSEVLWSTPRTKQDFSFEAREIRILKQGLIYRPRKIGLNMWYACVCVLTSSGFFHSFELSKSIRRESVEYYKENAHERESTTNSLPRSFKSSDDILERTGKAELRLYTLMQYLSRIPALEHFCYKKQIWG
jgi:hypothetical protein